MRRWFEVACVLSVLVLLSSAIAQETKVHVVKKGDTLWDLSGYYLANPFLWPGIYETNKDKIMDPHWIYPGQEFVIPPMYPAAPLAPPLPTPPPLEEGVEAPVEQPVEQPVEEVEPLQPVQELEPEVPLKTYEIPAVAARLALIGGYLAMDEEISGGYIISTETEEQRNLASTTTAYIDRGNLDGVNEGALFTVYRVDRGIKHPRTGEYLGKIIRVLGVVRAVDVEDRTSKVMIDRSFEFMNVNDRIMPYVAEKLPIGEIPGPTSAMLEGCIVARRDLKGVLMPFDLVYIDQGRDAGAQLGDVFEIYRPAKKVKDPDTGENVLLPESVVGTLQVLKLKDRSATAYIMGINGNTDLEPGELIRLRARLPAGG